MTVVSQLVPVARTMELSTLLAQIAHAPRVVPFSPDRVEFIADLSRRLGRRSGQYPEARALAYWLRRAELVRMRTSFDELWGEGLVLMPRGTVLHIPPANVDTMFVYSWALATLLGNRNVVRMSSRSTDQSNMILDVIREVLVDHPDVAEATAMITYAHDDHITTALSLAADTRVVWGGDQTITRIRALPLPPHATELTFADRLSLAAIDAAAFEALDDASRHELVEKFYNDTYFFDQMGCSSARVLIWVGEAERAAPDFRSRLSSVVAAKGYDVTTSTAVAKLGQAYRGMLDTDARALAAEGEGVTVLEVDEFPRVEGEFCGGGFFYELRVGDLADIVDSIERKDQTLAVFGFSHDQLSALVDSLVGRGIDRIVPIGKALEFNRYWDGYDLLSEFSRKVTIDGVFSR